MSKRLLPGAGALLLLLAVWANACAAERPRPAYFAIHAVDAQTGRGVPLVELRSVNGVRYWTDSNGLVAVDEPAWANRRVFFDVKSHGYEYAGSKDAFGYRGAILEIRPGGREEIKLRRVNIAERLYRITGEGIYRDSVMLGEAVPIREPLLNAQVTGQDSVQMAEYRGKLRWFYGDTNRLSYALGHFGTAGATSLKPSAGGLDPAKGIDLTYFVDAEDFSRPMCDDSGPGMKWIDGLVVVKDEKGAEKMLARCSRMKSLGECQERTLVLYNDAKDVLEPLVRLELNEVFCPMGQAFRYRVGETEFVGFATPFPNLRVKADLVSVRDPKVYEAFTCLAPGARYAKGETKIERGADGRPVWGWKRDAAPLDAAQLDELVKAGKLKPDELWNRIVDAEGGKPVKPHAGSVAYNAFRKRWTMIFHEHGGGPSFLGEVWYAESDAPEGPWTQARKVVTHDRYSFYNVRQHPELVQEGGRVVYFEGTYTAMFSGNPDTTPRYEYNQMMYRLDLSDPRLKLPEAGARP
jgi:hypothetical protein